MIVDCWTLFFLRRLCLLDGLIHSRCSSLLLEHFDVNDSRGCLFVAQPVAMSIVRRPVLSRQSSVAVADVERTKENAIHLRSEIMRCSCLPCYLSIAICKSTLSYRIPRKQKRKQKTEWQVYALAMLLRRTEMQSRQHHLPL